MPSLFPKCQALQSNHIFDIPRAFVCPSCLYRQAFPIARPRNAAQSQSKLSTLPKPTRRKFSSSVAPVTAVNAKKTVPPAFRELHNELNTFEKKAANYLNLSQLRLARNGLESKNAVVRVAVKGIDSKKGACRLVRALLADPLGPEATWETQLLSATDDSSRSLLIRYGEDYYFEERHPLLQTLSIPSTMLYTHKLEILVHNGRDMVDDNGVFVSEDSPEILVPALNTPISASGRVSTVTYPVHKAVAYGEGLTGIEALSHIKGLKGLGNAGLVFQRVINTPWQTQTEQQTPESAPTLVNVPLAEEAILAFRKSLENSMDYEHKWLASNMMKFNSWMIEGTSSQNSALKPAIRNLINVILSNVEQLTVRQEVRALAEVASKTVPLYIRQDLDATVTKWAEQAHRELRDRLELALRSPNWRKLAWWKLLWRVDDVAMITTDIVQQAWLLQAEKDLIFIAGCIQQAGLLGSDPSYTTIDDPIRPPNKHPMRQYINDFAPQASLDVVTPDRRRAYPQQISLTRSHFITTTIPPLQSLAQSLLLQGLSTTSLAVAVSALGYIAVLTPSAVEASAIVALGIVWSARRIQKLWEAARTEWFEMLKEEGRKVLGTVEGRCREAVRDGGVAVEDEMEIEGRGEARDAVKRVKEALARIK